MSKDVKKENGFGYQSKNGKICMIRCFKCGRENYAPAVASGTCAWCAYDANEKK